MGTGDSGYTSLPAHPHYESIQSEQTAYINSFPVADPNDPMFVYNPELSSLALQNINLVKFNELSRISEEGDSRSAKFAAPSAAAIQQMGRNSLPRHDAFRRESSNTSLFGDTEAKLLPMDTNSVISEQVSLWGDDQSYSLNPDVDHTFERNLEALATQSTRQVGHKLEVKTRYLLQIFTEASCFDFALLLSIILMDAASISRITNSAIRSGSLAICRQLRNGLKDVTRWSFQEWWDAAGWSSTLNTSYNAIFLLIVLQSRLSAIHDVAAATSLPIGQICNPTRSHSEFDAHRHQTESCGFQQSPHRQFRRPSKICECDIEIPTNSNQHNNNHQLYFYSASISDSEHVNFENSNTRTTNNNWKYQ